jgi:hypothetical protein
MTMACQNACHCRRRVARGADIMRARSSRPLSPRVVEGPRFLPPDPTAELVRRNHAAARVRPESIFITGLSEVLAADTTWVLKEVLGPERHWLQPPPVVFALVRLRSAIGTRFVRGGRACYSGTLWV